MRCSTVALSLVPDISGSGLSKQLMKIRKKNATWFALRQESRYVFIMEATINATRKIGVEVECILPIIGVGENVDVQRLLSERVAVHAEQANEEAAAAPEPLRPGRQVGPQFPPFLLHRFAAAWRAASRGEGPDATSRRSQHVGLQPRNG